MESGTKPSSSAGKPYHCTRRGAHNIRLAKCKQSHTRERLAENHRGRPAIIGCASGRALDRDTATGLDRASHKPDWRTEGASKRRTLRTVSARIAQCVSVVEAGAGCAGCTALSSPCCFVRADALERTQVDQDVDQGVLVDNRTLAAQIRSLNRHYRH